MTCWSLAMYSAGAKLTPNDCFCGSGGTACGELQLLLVMKMRQSSRRMSCRQSTTSPATTFSSMRMSLMNTCQHVQLQTQLWRSILVLLNRRWRWLVVHIATYLLIARHHQVESQSSQLVLLRAFDQRTKSGATIWNGSFLPESYGFVKGCFLRILRTQAWLKNSWQMIHVLLRTWQAGLVMQCVYIYIY